MADTPLQKPIVSDIVHYVSLVGHDHLAAIVTQVLLDIGVSLTVFDVGEERYPSAVLHDEHFGPGTWHWPERD